MSKIIKYELKTKSSHLDDLLTEKKRAYKRSVMIEEDVIEYFKKEGFKLGVTPGVLINALLKDLIDNRWLIK